MLTHEIVDDPRHHFGSYNGPTNVTDWIPNTAEGFKAFAMDLQEIQEDPFTPMFVLPPDLDFLIPDYYEFKEQEDLRVWNRIQVAIWLVHDPKFTKPVHIQDPNTWDELRVLSGLGPQIHSVSMDFTGYGESPITYPPELMPDLFTYYTSAGDYSAVQRQFTWLHHNFGAAEELFHA